jgi:hypothetical protein
MEPEDPNRERKDLAKQLGTYADATTAFAVIQSIAFAFALGSKDLRENILRTPPCLIPALCLVALGIYSLIVLACHLGENALIGKPCRKIDTHNWTRHLRFWRYAVMVLAESVALIGVYFTFRGQ